MFGRHIEIKLAKNAKQELIEDAKFNIPTLEEVAEVAKDLGKKAVVGVVIVIAAASAINAAQEIAVHHATKSKSNN